jgi:DNA-directed RNA polymerase subunit RPC12/RpoP
MLDERGIAYEADDYETYAYTMWGDRWILPNVFSEPLAATPHTLGAECELTISPVTAEQAVDATIGRDTPVYLCKKCGVAYELDYIDKEFGKPNYCPHCGYRRMYV